MQNTKLLIVDDDEDDYILARALLNDISPGPYCLDWAATFTEGEAQLKKNIHDLCLMDYQLGSDDGIKLLKRASELGFTGPIILLTGVHQGELDREALEAGAVDYLVKAHLTAEQLARSIRYALGRREMERERVERIRAESENRLKSEFLAHLSHELRTPLSAILGFTELLINKNEDAETLAHLRVVDRNGKHLLGLLNDILDLSKIEAGKLELEKQEIHLASFLSDIYALMHGSAVDKNLLLRLDTPTPLPTRIVTDPIRLRQVLLNLIGNAVKFTDQGEVAVLVAVDSKGGERERIRFSVKDTGMGIKTDIQEAVFQPFVQVRDKAHPRAGTGLGLAISKQLVTWLGGNISLTSEAGKGSEFVFTVDPGNIANMEREVFSLDFSSISHSHVTSIPRFKGRVLVVDDLRDIRLLIGHFVEATGLEVVYARDGVEAERIISEENWQGKAFDVVLMDIHMPERDGLETARKLRESGFTKPLVALTAAHMKGDVDICLASGFSAYLSKPVDQHQIHVCLAHYFTPLAESAATPEIDQRKLASNGAGVVLLVEDDPDALQATSGLLTLLGWDVIPAADASEAVEKARKYKPSFALVDLNLPDQDGYEVATQLHMVLPDVKVVIASGEEMDADRASRAGVSTGLLKPFSINQLERVLRKSP